MPLFEQACNSVRIEKRAAQEGEFWRKEDPVLAGEEGSDVRVGGMFEHQREWWNLPNFIKLLVAGYGSGKTMITCKRAISTALENAPCPTAIVSPTFPQARQTIIPTLEGLLSGKKTMLGTEFSYRYHKAFHEFRIKYHGREALIYCNSGENPNSLRGPNLGSAYIDEPFIQSKDVFLQMIARVRHPEARFKELGLTGCVTRDTLVWTDEGLIEIGRLDPGTKPKQYARLGRKVISEHNEFQEATKFYNNGMDDTVVVKAANSFEVCGTPDHPVLTMGLGGTPEFKRIGKRSGKYKNLQQLQVGDRIAVARGASVWGNHDFGIDADTMYGLGVWIAEGSWSDGDRFVISCGDGEVLKFFADGGCNGSEFNIKSNGRQAQKASKELGDLCRHLRMPIGFKSPARWIPDFVTQGTKEMALEFLGGMYDGDGHVALDGKVIGYTTTSKRLAHQLRAILANLGVIARIQEGVSAPTRLVKVHSRRFQVLALGQNASRLAKLLKVRILRKKAALVIYDRHYKDLEDVPHQAQLILTAWERRQCGRWRKGTSTLEPNKIIETVKKSKDGCVAYRTLRDFVNRWKANETFLPEEIKTIEQNLSDCYYWAQVRSIEKSGAKETVDFVIPGSRSFIGGGVVMCNTPEQLNWGYDLAIGSDKEFQDVGVVQASTRLNRTLGTDYVQRLLAALDEKTARAYIEGQFINLAKGQVYHAFDPMLHCQDLPFPETCELGVGMDFNVNPMACVVFWLASGHMHVVQEYEFANADTDFVAQTLKEQWGDRLLYCYPDASGSARKTSAPGGKSDFYYLQQHKFQIRAPYANPKRRDRYNAVNGKLKPACLPTGGVDLLKPRITLTIAKKCIKLRKYLATYTYEQMMDQKDMSHLLDAFSYPVSFLFGVSRDTIISTRLRGTY